MNKNSKVVLSKIFLIASMLIFGSVGIFRRLIPLPSAALAGYRGIAGAVFLLIFMLITGKSLRQELGAKRLAGLVVTGALIGINWMLLFEAYNYTTVASATLCYYMQPIIVILFSPVFFKEKLTVKKLLCVVVAMAGMVFVSGLTKGAGAQGSVKGIIFGLGAAAFYAAVVIMNKKLSGIDVYIKTMIELFGAAAVVLPYSLLTEDLSAFKPDTTAIIMLVIIGLVHTGVAYAMYFGSMDALPIQSVAIIGYLDPITALLLSVIVLREAISVYEIIGAVLILGATAVSELGNME